MVLMACYGNSDIIQDSIYGCSARHSNMKYIEFQHVAMSWMRQCNGFSSWPCFFFSAVVATTLCLKWPTSFLGTGVRHSITRRFRQEFTQSCWVWATQPKCAHAISQLDSKYSIGCIIMGKGADRSVWNAPLFNTPVSLTAMFLPVWCSGFLPWLVNEGDSHC